MLLTISHVKCEKVRSMLYLVGENIDKTRSHYQAQTGKIVQIMRGIYADATDDIDMITLRHAVRIAHYLYPHAYLSAASSALLAPTRDGRLFISGKRNQRTRIRALEIIQNTAPDHPSTGSAIIKDDMGEFRAGVSSIRQRFLEAFRTRSESAASIDDAMRAEIAARMIAEYETPKGTADAVWALARENGWYREGEQAERYLLKVNTVAPMRNEASTTFCVAWHSHSIGKLHHDGFEWRWEAAQNFDLPLVRQTVPGKLPPFILSLLPEGWLERVLKIGDERAQLRSARRYMSNITIAENAEEIPDLPADILLHRLADHSADGIFTGTYAGPGRGHIEESFEDNLAKLFSNAKMPRLSGVQIKAAMHLDKNGRLTPSIHEPFTHILKPAGTSGFQALPVIEYLSLALGRYAGFTVPDAALIQMPDGMLPALLVERFDIRASANDQRLIAMEDLCSVLGLPPEAKYDGTIEGIARGAGPLSTERENDLLLLLKRALFAWLIADGDMHLKNLALIKVALPGARSFQSVRMAPLYDAVTTQVFPGLEHDRMALKLNGKDNRIKRSDFQRMAATIGVNANKARDAIDELCANMKAKLESLAVPEIAGADHEIAARVDQMLTICRERLTEFA